MMQVKKGLAIVDLLQEIFFMVVKLHMPKDVKAFLLKEMVGL